MTITATKINTALFVTMAYFAIFKERGDTTLGWILTVCTMISAYFLIRQIKKL